LLTLFLRSSCFFSSRLKILISSKISELRKAAAHYGEPGGDAWFYAGIKRATDEEFSEQQERLKSGLIPNLNDLGSVYDAQQGIKKHGNQQ
jgi:hypothetical protein